MNLDAAKIAVATGQALEVRFHQVHRSSADRNPKRLTTHVEAFKTRDIVPGILPTAIPAKVEQVRDPLQGFRPQESEKQMRMFNAQPRNLYIVVEASTGRSSQSFQTVQAARRYATRAMKSYGGLWYVKKVKGNPHRDRTALAIDLTHRIGERGPRTYQARKIAAEFLDGVRPWSR